MHQEGFEVEILFDGAGTEWPNEFSKADFPFNQLYKDVMKTGIIKGGCKACSNFHDAQEEMQAAGVQIAAANEDLEGHIPFANYIKNGFFPIIL